MVRVERNKDQNFDVMVNGSDVGTVSMHDEFDIAYVEVDEEHRGNGYGPKAVRQVVETVTDETNRSIRVSTPVDDSIRWILREIGFQEEFVMGDKILVLYQ